MIGDRESVLCFRAVGFDVVDTTEFERAKEALFEFASKNYGIIFVTEQVAQLLEKQLEAYKDSTVPAIIVLPGSRGSNGMGLKAVKKSVERAVGADILFQSSDNHEK
jgi:V/A-type H+-transporting ATPase subunit F